MKKSGLLIYTPSRVCSNKNLYILETSSLLNEKKKVPKLKVSSNSRTRPLMASNFTQKHFKVC
jgi:hypothetical protein